jgi:hypothetical protein
MTIKHATTKSTGDILYAVADWNADHIGTATPEAHGNEAHTEIYITGEQVPIYETDPIFLAKGIRKTQFTQRSILFRGETEITEDNINLWYDYNAKILFVHELRCLSDAEFRQNVSITNGVLFLKVFEGIEPPNIPEGSCAFWCPFGTNQVNFVFKHLNVLYAVKMFPV